ncbi:MFS transporter [Fodinicola acaciae]|uniref:MFS transporter n=1 Tax=Fodinicola acaciae TaxID=2681555 RepID=UPI0013D7890F|nr:MFS transporter [Fodinicola acaciae]
MTVDQADTAAQLTGRLDRIPTWSLSRLFIAILGLGVLFVQYDIFDINVSFIQTCVAITPGCTPANAVGFLNLPILLSLVGYGIGAIGFAPLADRIGRRHMLVLTMLLTGLGSLYTALSQDYGNFTASRFITGVGIGADLAIVNTYVNEVAPRAARAKYTSVLFVLAAIGSALGVWLGLLLTTPSAPWPQGLPFALASADFSNGWRWMYALGAILALVSVALRFQLPESPRWLLARGRLAEALAVVQDMEKRASRFDPLPDPQPEVTAEPVIQKGAYRQLFGSRTYLLRCVVLAVAWMAGYVTLYGFGAGFTSVLTALNFSPSTAGVIAAVGLIGFIASAVVAILFAEKLERKYWLAVGAGITVLGALLVALAGASMIVALVGAIVLFFGQNVWVAPQYSLTAESFPTRFRTSGYAIADSVGHIGGGIGVFVIAGLLGNLSVLGALLLIGGFLVIAAAVNLLAVRTRGRRLGDISP